MSALNSVCQFGCNIVSSTFQFAKKVAIPITTCIIGFPAHTWIHEKGHCLIAEQLFENANARIIFWNNIPHLCQVNLRTLNVLGKYLGRNNSMVLLLLGGPLAEIAALTSVSAFSSKVFAQTMFCYSSLSLLELLAHAFPLPSNDYESDYEGLLKRNIYAFGALATVQVLSTAFIAYRAFKK